MECPNCKGLITEKDGNFYCKNCDDWFEKDGEEWKVIEHESNANDQESETKEKEIETGGSSGNQNCDTPPTTDVEEGIEGKSPEDKNSKRDPKKRRGIDLGIATVTFDDE